MNQKAGTENIHMLKYTTHRNNGLLTISFSLSTTESGRPKDARHATNETLSTGSYKDYTVIAELDLMWNSTGDITAVSRKSFQVSSQNHFIERYDRKNGVIPWLGPKLLLILSLKLESHFLTMII